MKKVNNIKFDDWHAKMAMLCNRNPLYNIRQVTYSVNPYADEQIKEEERINKPKNDIKNVFANRKIKIKPNI
jgi:hypothetical protein